jgi:hypothetical protein
MRLPWSKKDNGAQVEVREEEIKESNFIERSLKLGKKGTWVMSAGLGNVFADESTVGSLLRCVRLYTAVRPFTDGIPGCSTVLRWVSSGIPLSGNIELILNRYANASIGPAGTIIKTYIYPQAFPKGSQNASLLSSMAFAGIIIGQLGFGWVSDKVGRKVSLGFFLSLNDQLIDVKTGMLICTGIVFVFSALQAASKGPGAQGTINALIAYRFFAGIGIGGSTLVRRMEVQKADIGRRGIPDR